MEAFLTQQNGITSNKEVFFCPVRGHEIFKKLLVRNKDEEDSSLDRSEAKYRVRKPEIVQMDGTTVRG